MKCLAPLVSNTRCCFLECKCFVLPNLLLGEDVSHQIRIPRPGPHRSWNVGIGFGPNVARTKHPGAHMMLPSCGYAIRVREGSSSENESRSRRSRNAPGYRSPGPGPAAMIKSHMGRQGIAVSAKMTVAGPRCNQHDASMLQIRGSWPQGHERSQSCEPAAGLLQDCFGLIPCILTKLMGASVMGAFSLSLSGIRNPGSNRTEQ